MNFEIRTGDLECPFTGKPTSMLVRVCSEDNDSSNKNLSDACTGWLSVHVLEKCLHFMNSVSSIEDNDVLTTSAFNAGIARIELSIGRMTQILSGTCSQPKSVSHVEIGDTDPDEASLPVAPLKKAPLPQVISQRDKASQKQFAEEVANLLNDPPVDDNPLAKSGGLAESHIRELMRKWRSVFENPMLGMYPILQKAFGMSKERFEIIIKGF